MPYTAAKVRVHLHEVIRANKVTEGCARIYLVYNTVASGKATRSFRKWISSFTPPVCRNIAKRRACAS